MSEQTSGGPPSGWHAEPETRQLRLLQSAMTDAETALARRLEMGHTDVVAMTHLAAAQEPVGPGWLSHRLGLTPAAATELVDRLERVGHVARSRDHADRRRVNLIPTAASLQTVQGQVRPLMDAVDAAASAYSDEERETIRRFLAEVIDIYADYAADPDS